MQRKFNYTGRKKIARYRIPVSCKTHESGHYTFDISVNLERMKLPEDAKIFVEAYYRTSYMRFDWGTVGAIKPPENNLIDGIEEGIIPFFRVKVVEDGIIRAAADRISPSLPEDEEKEKTSLLPVEYRDLGNTVWKLELDEEPVLLLNNTIDGIREAARSDPMFLSLVYPEIVRRILYEAVIKRGFTDDEDDWENRWVNFAEGLGVSEPPEGIDEAATNDKEQWIDDAVSAFSREIKAKDKFTKSLMGE